MNKIIIPMRHGQPNMVPTEKNSMLEMKDWIEQYNRSEIIRHTAPNASLQLVATAKVIVSSNAPRALTESPRIP